MLITSVVSRATLQRLLSCMLFCCICATSAQAAIDNPGVIPDDRLTHPQDGPDTVARNFGLWDDTETGGRTTFETLDFRKNGHRGQHYWSCFGSAFWHPQHVVRLPNKDGRAYFMATNSFATDTTTTNADGFDNRIPSGYLSLYRSDSVVDPLTDLVPNSPGTDGEIIWEDIYDSNWPYKSDAEGWNHPGQMQVIGGLLLVSMEQWYDNSIGLYRTLYCDDYGDGAGLDTVFFYDVRDPENPVYWGKLDKNELGVTGSVNRVHLFKAKDQWVLVVGDRVFTASEVSPQISAGGGPGFTFWGVNVDDFLFQTHGGLFYSYEDYDPISSLPSPSVPSPGEKRAMYFDGVEDKDNYVVGDEVLKFANICFDPQWYVQCQFEPTPPPPDPSLTRKVSNGGWFYRPGPNIFGGDKDYDAAGIYVSGGVPIIYAPLIGEPYNSTPSDKIYQIHNPANKHLTLSQALDDTSRAWATGGDGDWYARFSSAAQPSDIGNSMARTSRIDHAQSSYLETTFNGAGSLSFRWRVDSEPWGDVVRFYLDDVEQAALSGDSGWQTYTLNVPSGGPHKLRWEYSKNASVSSGADAAWLDGVIINATLADAVNAPALVWTTDGVGGLWFSRDTSVCVPTTLGQTSCAYHRHAPPQGDDGWIAQTFPIASSETASLQADVEGPGTLSFWWMVSSESGGDFLGFTLDGATAPAIGAPISGERPWQQKTLNIPAGIHTIRWTYGKDADLFPEYGVDDAAYLDKVTYTPHAVTSTADNGDGSLRQTIESVPAGTTITFSPSLNGKTITLRDGTSISSIASLEFFQDMVLDASALPDGVTLRLSNFRLGQTSAGASHSCALDDGGVTCWGSNSDGQSVPPATLYNAAQVTAGGAHSCALDDNGVTCWGAGTTTIGPPAEFGQSIVPTLVTPLEVSAGAYHTCAIDQGRPLGWHDNGVVCWGAGTTNSGQSPEFGQSIVPTGAQAHQVRYDISKGWIYSQPVSVSSGRSHTCALMREALTYDDGSAQGIDVVCWGDNSQNQLAVPVLSNPVAVSAGDYHTCALDDNGVHCWGAGTANTGIFPEYGQSSVPALGNPVAVSAGENHTCALDDNGVVCWGAGTTNTGQSPEFGQSIAPALSNLVAVSAGGLHTCALTDSGGVVCWGSNSDGQIATPPAPPFGYNTDMVYVASNINVVFKALEIIGRGQLWGINNDGHFTCDGCTISGHQFGIKNSAAAATLHLLNTTISGNGPGVGLLNSGGTASLVHTTISDNHGSPYAGGIWNVSPSILNIENSVVAGNTKGVDVTSGIDITANGGTINVDGVNLVGINESVESVFPAGPLAGTRASPLDPGLLPLGEYGGPTRTMPPGKTSLVVDAALSTANSPPTDQRGVARPAGVADDLGAVEFPKILVTNTDDAGPGSLRQAISDAPPGSLIVFDPGLPAPATILLTSGELYVDKDLEIDTWPSSDTLILDGNNTSRVLRVAGNAEVTLSGLTLTRGNADHGAGILNHGTLTLNECSLVDNHASLWGGAITNWTANLTVNNSTLSGNSAAKSGGGIYNAQYSNATLVNSTLSGNHSDWVGGGISNLSSFTIVNSTITANSVGAGYSVGGINNLGAVLGGLYTAYGVLTLVDSIVAANSGMEIHNCNGVNDCATVYAADNLIGNNLGVEGWFPAGPLVGTAASPLDPVLAPLANYGGRTQTHLPLFGSAAINAAADASQWTGGRDQRGVMRPAGIAPDIGAVEIVDSDGDGIGDEDEVLFKGTDPLDADTDNDGIPDGLDMPPGRNPLRADRAVSAGSLHTCALDDGGVTCWGLNTKNQSTVPSLNHPVAVDAGRAHSCAIDDSGVVCWGDNTYQQTSVPATLGNPLAVSTGWGHTCALDDSGVTCWGMNTYGQATVPTSPSLSNPVMVAAGNYHSCALDDNGVHCWGAGTTNTGSGTEYGQSIVPSLSNPVAVNAGALHTCALDDSGVHCWGAGTTNTGSGAEYGQSIVPSLSSPFAVNAGQLHTCALDANGVHCWGAGTTNTGSGTEYGQSIVPSLVNPVAVTAGDYHSCALEHSSVRCWGRNDVQQSTAPLLVFDADRDGLEDRVEDSNGNGLVDAGETDPRAADSDGDGVIDGSDALPLDPTEWLDTDGDGTGNNADSDDDGDGLDDVVEDANGNGSVDAGETDPLIPDSDADGLADGVEDANHNGTVDAGETNPLNPDSDADGLADGVEDVNHNGTVDAGETNPLNPDSDADGLPDGIEDANQNGLVDAGETDPRAADSDGDGVIDGSDALPLDPTEWLDTDGDGTGNNADSDDDGDGLDDVVEDANGNGSVDAGETDPLNPDSDADGLADGVEDANHNGTVDAGETNPLNPDSDADGLADGVEDANHNGTVDAGETDPLDADSDDDNTVDGADACPLDPGEQLDTDRDGICNNADSDDDNDTIPDSFDQPPGRDPLVADWMVSVGRYHSCALDDTGVHCWGAGTTSTGAGNVEFGQSIVPALSNPVAVSAGGYHTCALDDAGVHCWGADYPTHSWPFATGQITVPVLSNPRAVSAGGFHTCALDDTGVRCWGLNTSGQLTVPALTNPVAVSAGYVHTCALDDSGVHCWGDNSGQATVPTLSNPVAVSAGGFHTCALDDTGVRCWGLNTTGQTTVPTFPPLSNPVAVSAGYAHTCALDDNGVHCWSYGQATVLALTNPVAVSAGGDTCWLDDNGVHCSGPVPVLAFDKDRDGLQDRVEDSDGNGVVDAGETDPLNPDSDADGLADGVEDANHNGTVDAGETDPLNPDSDADGLADGVEDANHNGTVDAGETNPLNPDSDADGLPDGIEDANQNGLVDAGETDPRAADSDGDGVIDGSDALPLDPTEWLDTDSDGIGNNADSDDDGDGLDDFVEDANGNGSIDAGETDPLNPDTDGDGYSDGAEVAAGSDPLNNASVPASANGDVNGDGQVDVADLLRALQILQGQYLPTAQEQARWDVAPLVNGVPQPDQQNNLGDYLILLRKVQGIINF